MSASRCLAFAAFVAVGLPATAPAQRSDSLLAPFTMEHRAADASSLDLSFLLDAPAGKRGFTRVRDGHLVRGDGTRLRLWGIHFTDWSRGSVLLPPREDSPLWAGTLARYGINCVRLHFLDLDAPRGLIAAGSDSRHLDAQQLDRLDFLVAELEKRGIYVDLNLNVGRSYRAGDSVPDFDRIRWAKGLTLFDPRLIALQKEYARMLLTHVNPYTGKAYRDDPAVAIVEILNENGVWVGFTSTPYYDAELTTLYNEWLAKNLPRAELARLREITGAADAPVPRLKSAEVGAAPKERFLAESRFIVDVETRFYTGMRAFLRDSLGVRVPITGTADHGHSSSSYPMLMSLSKLDVVDGHVYWQHPGSPPPVNTPMVNDPLHSTVVQLSRTAMAGTPYTVSEFNHPFPNEWAAEGIPIAAAYGAFQDWDAIIVYTFEPKRDASWKSYVGDPFDISLDPVRMTQMATGALAFLRSDVRPALETVSRSYAREQAFESRRLARTEQPYFTPGFPLALPLTHGVRIASLDGAPTAAYASLDTATIVSDTRQLVWRTTSDHRGLVTEETDRTQALIGFVRGNRPAVKNLVVDLRNEFAAVVLSAIDAKPISSAGRLLLTAGSRVSNTGSQWNEDRTRLTQQGGAPSLIEPVTGTVTLRGLAGRVRGVSAVALDGAGKAIGAPIAATRSTAGWTLPIGAPVTTWYLVRVDR
ncbi:MAG: hypothetical protein DMD35_06900 [Gemmatimonadetes bacterium]|nr:MAG: hypothetical protein DMD35_06900 [Gemmatimonadota bacterium]